MVSSVGEEAVSAVSLVDTINTLIIYAFIAIYSCGSALFRIMGNSAVSMKISIVMNLINVAGNALLIFGFHFGVEGVAIPTLASRVFAAVVILIWLRKGKYTIHLSKPFRPKLEKHIIKNILRFGVPNGIESSLFNLGKVLLLSVVSSLGTASIAANAIANTVCNFQILPASAIGTAMITVVSQCVGARDFMQVHFYTKKLLKWAYVSMFIAVVIMVLLQPFIIKAYGVSPEASRMANILLWMHGGMGILLWPLSFVFPQSIKAAGDVTFTMFMSIGSMWVFRIVAGVIFGKYLGLGVIGIWVAMFIDWIVRTIAISLRYKSGKWKRHHLE